MHTLEIQQAHGQPHFIATETDTSTHDRQAPREAYMYMYYCSKHDEREGSIPSQARTDILVNRSKSM